MTLRLYNTLTRAKEDFVPLDRENVRMYVCGPTVYDYAHIGNARPVIVFDVLFRLLRHLYGPEHVTYARNITDVDDKINRRAAEEYPDLPLNEAIARVTEKTGRQFHADVKALGCLEPTVEPRATGHIEEMKVLIERLVGNGAAYVAEDHVLFRVAEAKDYGALSRRSLDEMIAGARVDVAPYKQDPMDFVLWKPSKAGEPAWPSPSGIRAPGRPGWHIECSAMAWKHLGEVFDIHGGGIDLVFPHHENELAQSRSALRHDRMANVWMHNGFLQVEGKKMAKSEGNFVTINELLKDWPGDVLRLNMLKTHYRQPIDWTWENLQKSSEDFQQWRYVSGLRKGKRSNVNELNKFVEFLCDDLNTPGAISVIQEVVAKEAPTPAQKHFVYEAMKLLGLSTPLAPIKRAADAFRVASRVLSCMSLAEIREIISKSQNNAAYKDGRLRPETKFMLGAHHLVSLIQERGLNNAALDSILARQYEELFAPVDPSELRTRTEIQRLVDIRNRARELRNWAESDRIRDELFSMGVMLKDNKDGTTTWELKR